MYHTCTYTCTCACVYTIFAELIRQQKEKLISLESSSDKTSEERGDSLSDNDHKLLRRLVMSSLAQLAEIAYDIGSSGSMEDQGSYEEEEDLDRIDDDDKELGASSWSRDNSKSERQQSTTLGREASREREPVGSEVKVHRDVDTEEVEKVSDKMKKMANDVKNTGKDSALESLLANLAVTAQFIESLENEDEDPSSSTGRTSEEASDRLEGDLKQYEDGDEGRDTEGDMTGKGPPVVEGDRETGRTSVSGADGDAMGDRAPRSASISSEILAASGLEESAKEKEGEEEFELDPELVREMEQHLEEALAKQLDTKG